MRIAVVTWCDRIVGGAETYLASVIPALVHAGHEVRVWVERTAEPTRERIAPGELMAARAVDVGAERWLMQLNDWHPAVIYSHGLTRPALEARLPPSIPLVFFAHNYFGTCVSGEKTWKSPSARPCTRRLGAGCLAHYYPHRCGGLSLRTMWRGYRTQSRRLHLLRRATALLTASDHMRREYLRHGFAPAVLKVVPLPVVGLDTPAGRSTDRGDRLIRLVFAGRMDHLKGGHVLIESLPLLGERMQRPVHVIFLGDGPARGTWESSARKIMTASHEWEIVFRGWVDRETRDATFADADLFVMPSLWPEPFGLAGLEAGRFGLPTAAFGVGGIPEWLTDGVNGAVAPLDYAPAASLAHAIGRCLDPGHHGQLRDGAREVAGRYTMDRHLAALLPVLEGAAQ